MDDDDELDPPEPDTFDDDDDYLDDVHLFVMQNEDSWRLAGYLFHGDEFNPDLSDGDTILFDLGRCPWRPRGAWRSDGAPFVLVGKHCIRQLEYTPAGWLLTAPGHEPVPVSDEALVTGTALRISRPVERLERMIAERWKDWRLGDPPPPPVTRD